MLGYFSLVGQLRVSVMQHVTVCYFVTRKRHVPNHAGDAAALQQGALLGWPSLGAVPDRGLQHTPAAFVPIWYAVTH